MKIYKKDDRGPLDLTRVIDEYEQLLKDADAKMMVKLAEIQKLKNNRSLNSMDEIAYFELRNKNEFLQKEISIQRERAQAAEIETSLIKATGMNSPEMRDAKKKIQDLEDLLKSRDYTRQHDYKFLVNENKELHKEADELKRDNKQLALQITELYDRLRDSNY